jgi:hypothetical protein
VNQNLILKNRSDDVRVVELTDQIFGRRVVDIAGVNTAMSTIITSGVRRVPGVGC